MILADYQVNGQFPSKVATSGTAAVYFPRTLGTNGPASSPLQPTATNAAGQLGLPGSQQYAAVQGQRLRVIASGSAFTAASQTVNVTMQINTGSIATPAYTTMATTGAQTVNGRASWILEAHFVVAGNASLAADNGTGFFANFGSAAPLVQGQLSGLYTAAINGATLAAAWTVIPATTNAVVLAALPVLSNGLYLPGTSGIVVNVAFGTGTAGNNATLNQFTILGD